MQLNHVSKHSFGNWCFACAHAGEDAILFPQEYRGKNPIHQWLFDIYYKNNLNPQAMFHGAKVRTCQFCERHAKILYDEWIEQARQEVEFAKAYNSWIDRVENEREDLYFR